MGRGHREIRLGQRQKRRRVAQDHPCFAVDAIAARVLVEADIGAARPVVELGIAADARFGKQRAQGQSLTPARMDIDQLRREAAELQRRRGVDDLLGAAALKFEATRKGVDIGELRPREPVGLQRDLGQAGRALGADGADAQPRRRAIARAEIAKLGGKLLWTKRTSRSLIGTSGGDKGLEREQGAVVQRERLVKSTAQAVIEQALPLNGNRLDIDGRRWPMTPSASQRWRNRQAAARSKGMQPSAAKAAARVPESWNSSSELTTIRPLSPATLPAARRCRRR